MITDWLMVMITFVYVIATIFICIYNGKSAKAANEQTVVARNQIEEMVKEYNAVNRPLVTVHFDIIRSGLLCFIIENEGPLPAKDVKIKINQEFIDNLESVEPKNSLNKLNDASFYLASKQKMTVMIGGKLAFNDIAKVIAKFAISYSGFNEQVEIDISQYNFLLVYSSSIEDISQHIKGIKEKNEMFQKDIINVIKKTPRVQNIVMHQATDDDSNKFKIFKVVCIEGGLTSIQIADKLDMDKDYVLNLLLELCMVDKLVEYTVCGFDEKDEDAKWYRI